MSVRAPAPLTLDLVVPVFNEAPGVERFHRSLMRVQNSLAVTTTVDYVEDGSTDGTAEVLHKLARQDARVVVLELSRNFGHQAALTAGLDTARGQVVVTMDGDGQHPPELLPEMLQLFH